MTEASSAAPRPAPPAGSILVHAGRLPKPADPARAAVGLERWQERIRASHIRTDADGWNPTEAGRFADNPAGRAILESIFGNSGFLTECVLADPGFLLRLCAAGPETAADGIFERVRAGATETADALMARLRHARREMALTTALADLCELWPLERVTRALSQFADLALNTAVAHLFAVAEAGGEIRTNSGPGLACSGYVVLGMGKLGAYELNYSSDIDLIVLYDEETVDYRGRRSVPEFFQRLTQVLVRILEERTAQGYVFRTDLRLRPDPGSTPPALSIGAAATYYESMGQNWERAAMIKARPVAGDKTLGAGFLDQLKPFIWRKHLDFAAIQDIQSIKRQIALHRGGVPAGLLGRNLKLGRGGIREIEFFAQTLQLIWGGRQPALRVAPTCAALAALTETGHVAENICADLTEAYRYLRQMEHRLQMVDDRQTHSLPEDAAALARFSVFAGFSDMAAFVRRTETVLASVQNRYDGLFPDEVPLGGPGSLAFTGADPSPDTLATLAGLGFRQADSIWQVIRGWHHGRYAATRSARARELLTELMPTLLGALGRTANPDFAFFNFDAFLGRLPAGVQLFSLFQANPDLLHLVAEIMGSAPRLAQYLSAHPGVLDAVIAEDILATLPDAAGLRGELERNLAEARDVQDVHEIVRRWTKDRHFQLGVQMLRGLVDPDSAGPSLSDVADVAIGALLERVQAEFALRHGRVEGGGLAIVGFGKYGSRELAVGSDLDLVFVFDAPVDVAQSDGPRPLAPHVYYARLAQRLIGAITAETGEGRLFDIDTRLRPFGESGPVVSSLASYRAYYEESAWTWEIMALTRARVVGGPSPLVRAAEELRARILRRRRDPDALLRDVAEMRVRMAREHPAPSVWSVKHHRGGLVDVEFIAQYFYLRDGEKLADLDARATGNVLAALAARGILSPKAAEDLILAGRLWRRVQGMIRLIFGGEFPEDGGSEGSRAALARAAQLPDFESLHRSMLATAARVRAYFDELIDKPARSLPHSPAQPDQESRP